MDNKNRVRLKVREIEQKRIEMGELWQKIRDCIDKDNIEEAIMFLNRYYSLEEKLVGAESELKGILKGYFSDR